jgi:hypothetical protein
MDTSASSQGTAFYRAFQGDEAAQRRSTRVVDLFGWGGLTQPNRNRPELAGWHLARHGASRPAQKNLKLRLVFPPF